MTILVIFKSKYHEPILRTKVEESQRSLHMRNVSALLLMIFLGLGQQLTKRYLTQLCGVEPCEADIKAILMPIDEFEHVNLLIVCYYTYKV